MPHLLDHGTQNDIQAPSLMLIGILVTTHHYNPDDYFLGASCVLPLWYQPLDSLTFSYLAGTKVGPIITKLSTSRLKGRSYLSCTLSELQFQNSCIINLNICHTTSSFTITDLISHFSICAFVYLSSFTPYHSFDPHQIRPFPDSLYGYCGWYSGQLCPEGCSLPGTYVRGSMGLCQLLHPTFPYPHCTRHINLSGRSSSSPTKEMSSSLNYQSSHDTSTLIFITTTTNNHYNNRHYLSKLTCIKLRLFIQNKNTNSDIANKNDSMSVTDTTCVQ